jgi:Macrocin-O-methyltransferase (TylF)
MTPDDVDARSLYLDLLERCLTASMYDESSWVRWSRHTLGKRGIRNWFKSLVPRLLAKFSLSLIYHRRFDPTAREEGRDWPMFGYSMIGLKRMRQLRQCVESVVADRVPGDLIETGVWRGGASIMMRAVLKSLNVRDRVVWCADSFEGLPAPKLEVDKQDRKYDLSGLDYLAVSVEQVQDNFRRFDLLDEQVRFLKGWFRDTLPTAPVSTLSVLRLDGDLYESTMDALVHLYPKLSPGGYVIVDDYHAWPTCKQAVTEFRDAQGIRAPLQEVDGTAVFWRRTGD